MKTPASLFLLTLPLAAAPVDFTRDIRPILENVCFDCHGDGTAKGDVALDKYPDHAALLRDVKLWQTVWDAVNNRVMPPRKKTQPTDDERAKLLAWIEREVFKVDCENPDPGRVTLRRLNRREYDLSVQDLFGIKFSPAEDFPPDDSGYGFDNIADVLTLSPVLMDKYFTAAEQVVGKVVHLDPPQEPVRVLPYGALKLVSDPDELRRVREAHLQIEREGDYTLTVDLILASFDPFTGEVIFSAEIDGREIKRQAYGNEPSRVFTCTFTERLTAGAHTLRVINDLATGKVAKKGAGGINFQTTGASLCGPAGTTEYPEAHCRLFSQGPAPADAKAREAYACEILRRVSERAFRRPVDEATLGRLTALALEQAALPGKSFELGVSHAIQGILVLPRFLFRAETQPQPDDPSAVHPLDEFSLASRLSYFLRGSLPDEELLALAKSGQLAEGEVLAQPGGRQRGTFTPFGKEMKVMRSGSNRSFHEIGIPEGHHHVSHHQGMAAKQDKVAQIDRFYVEQLGYFLKKLDALKDPDGRSILDNSMIMYGCSISDGDDHNNDDLPIVLAGGGGGTFTPGRHVKFGHDVPLANLFVTMLDRMGVRAEKVGDSNGKLTDV